MRRILIVHRRSLQDLRSLLGSELASHDVEVIRFPLDSDLPRPSESVQLAVLGLRPAKAREAADHFGCDVPRIFRNLKGSNAELRQWIHRGECSVAPEEEDASNDWPGFKAFVLASVPGTNIILADRALVRADRIVGPEDLYGHHFPPFVRDAIALFGTISGPDADARSITSVAAEFSNLRYAPTDEGCECLYRDPFAGKERRSQKHLKPRTERSGHYPAEQKPRLYFDICVDADISLKWVVFLYLGPHLQRTSDTHFVVELPK